MTPATKRSIFRWIHLLLGLPIIGYVYTPFEELPSFAHYVRFLFLPLLILTGLYLWKGHLLTRLFTKKSA